MNDTGSAASAPRACLLHHDVHPMTSVCWEAVSAWVGSEKTRYPHRTVWELQDAYELTFERSLLDQLVNT
ncbi:hypothetical protein [Streptomyces sp. NRRL S-350]|uniref:hypothetical protein n=1 Tax=Streptomyces sp. NRRL S-350 TaxID=1463902 RepID=UPI0004BE47C8|nr:hypothetical protein [Streptomyces sp. NRRL S-350]